MGYMVFFKDGLHHQQMKVERMFKKKKQQKKGKKPQHESFAIFGEWVSGGEESSAISSDDESSKKFATRTNMRSSSNNCLKAKGMDSDVSDDDFDSPSYEELLELVHEHQRVIKKQTNEVENLNGLNNFNAIFAINYEKLFCKFKFLSEEHEKLKLKIERITKINNSLEAKLSTSCIDSIDVSNSCNEKCFEDIVVELCDDLIAKENDELK